MEKNTLENLVPGTEPKHNLPKTMRVGAILRNKKIIIPNSETIFEENDDVVFFSETSSVRQLEKLLSIRQQFS